jgi:hypothetical protein
VSRLPLPFGPAGTSPPSGPDPPPSHRGGQTGVHHGRSFPMARPPWTSGLAGAAHALWLGAASSCPDSKLLARPF